MPEYMHVYSTGVGEKRHTFSQTHTVRSTMSSTHRKKHTKLHACTHTHTPQEAQ